MKGDARRKRVRVRSASSCETADIIDLASLDASAGRNATFYGVDRSQIPFG